jgi:hypothetical protein
MERGRVSITIDAEREGIHTQSFDRIADARTALGWNEPAALGVSTIHGWRDWTVRRRHGGRIVLAYGREETGALYGQMADWIERAAEVVGDRPLEPTRRPADDDATGNAAAVGDVGANGALTAVRTWAERNNVLLGLAIGVLAIVTAIAVAVVTH